MSENGIKNRGELVFLYDVRDANPNGDPDNANYPRMDEETGENIVTDLRLKRTIRDFWMSRGEEVLVRAETDEKGNRKSMADLVRDFLGIKAVDKKKKEETQSRILDELPKTYIDVRAFGAAVTLEGANLQITGAAQFGLGRSLNKPNVKSLTITTTLSSGTEKGQGTIGEYHIVDYSLIRFHGIISEINARVTGFSESDLEKLFTAMWDGTLQLNTRSKFNHTSRLLIYTQMKPGKPQIGDLDLSVRLYGDDNPKSIEEVQLDISELLDRIKVFKDDIDTITVKINDELKTVDSTGKAINLIQELENLGISVKEL